MYRWVLFLPCFPVFSSNFIYTCRFLPPSPGLRAVWSYKISPVSLLVGLAYAHEIRSTLTFRSDAMPIFDLVAVNMRKSVFSKFYSFFFQVKKPVVYKQLSIHAISNPATQHSSHSALKQHRNQAAKQYPRRVHIQLAC